MSLKELERPLAEQAERSEGLDSCARRAGGAAAVLARIRESEGQAEVRWVEVYGHAAQLHVHAAFVRGAVRRQMMDHPRAWIFTSATLAVGEDFRHFTRELACPKPRRAAGQAVRLRAPGAALHSQGLPLDPNDPAFTQAVVEAALPFSRRVRARVPALHHAAALRRAHELLRSASVSASRTGDGSRSELLSRFRALGNAVLLGSQSFWEGVDVRGEALSVVVIDKLPFAPPDDPVLAARIESIRRDQAPGALLETAAPLRNCSSVKGCRPLRGMLSMRAASTGSSGGANGSLSITTTESASPRTSTPSQKDWLPRSTALPSARKRDSSSLRDPVPCTRSGKPMRLRSSSCARRSARSVVKSRNARPPLASRTGKRRLDHRLRERRSFGSSASPWNVEQRLAREVERACPAARLGFGHAELAGEMPEVLADGRGWRK